MKIVSRMLKMENGVLVGVMAVGGAVAIASYYSFNKVINQINADTDRIMKETFGTVDEEEK